MAVVLLAAIERLSGGRLLEQQLWSVDCCRVRAAVTVWRPSMVEYDPSESIVFVP